MNIVIQPFHDYHKWIREGFRTRDAHLYEKFITSPVVDNLVIINRPVSIIEKIINYKYSYMLNGEIVYKNKNVVVTQVKRNVYIVDVFVNDTFSVVINRKKWWSDVFRKEKILVLYNDVLKFLSVEKHVLFLQNPMAVSLMDNLNSDLVVFDTIDNWLEHDQMKKNKATIRENYGYIDLKADLILSVSEDNKKLFPKNFNFYTIPNGVDKEKFICQDISNSSVNRKKVLGYVGKIQDRFDFDLLEQVANKFYDNKIKVLGPIYSGKDNAKKLMKKYKNINFTGNIDYDSLPCELKKIDVALIPHKVNEFTSSMNPLKLYEYLAAGKPVVSTNIAGIKGISDYVYISSSDNSFIENIDKALKLENSEISNISSSLPQESEWQHISAEILELFGKYLKE